MHKDLKQAFSKLLVIIKEDERCLGGWHFGSVGRGTADEHSDYDIVFLVNGKDIESFATDIPKIMAGVCDEVIVGFDEGFNNERFKCFCYAIRINENIHQVDVFIMNNDHPEDWMCKLHLTGCTSEHIFFDRTGETAELLSKGYRIDNNTYDVKKIMNTYWFHVIMLIKYFKRGDVFKVIKNIDILFHSHADLLLSKYDTLEWGGWESKVTYCVPADKQKHLKAYFAPAELSSLKSAVKNGIEFFESDSIEICTSKDIELSKTMQQQIKTYFYDKVKI
jgi:predicted nucleotidyltransferase